MATLSGGGPSEFTYRCLRCAHRTTAVSRPDGCPRCGGWLANATLVGQWLDDRVDPPTTSASTYECLDCGRRLTVGRRPEGCPACDGPLRTVATDGRA